MREEVCHRHLGNSWGTRDLQPTSTFDMSIILTVYVRFQVKEKNGAAPPGGHSEQCSTHGLSCY